MPGAASAALEFFANIIQFHGGITVPVLLCRFCRLRTSPAGYAIEAA